MDKVFLPLARLHARGRFVCGLAIVKALMDAEGGSIEALSSPAGSTFVISTPTREATLNGAPALDHSH
jgi:nitrogen-specific signal transduction histidine kinase